MKKRTEEELILEHLETVQEEKEILKRAMMNVGGRPSFGGTLSNIIFAILVIGSFALSVILRGRYSLLAIEFGVLLISLKIIYLMRYQDKVTHFLFWVLTGMELRIAAIRKEVRIIKEKLDKLENEVKKNKMG